MSDHRDALLADMKATGKFCLCSVTLQVFPNGERIFVQKPRYARILVSPAALSLACVAGVQRGGRGKVECEREARPLGSRRPRRLHFPQYQVRR